MYCIVYYFLVLYIPFTFTQKIYEKLIMHIFSQSSESQNHELIKIKSEIQILLDITKSDGNKMSGKTLSIETRKIADEQLMFGQQFSSF